MDKLIITVAAIGAEVTKTDNPNLPITPDEIAEEVYKAYQAGASVAHIHARKPDGTPTQDKEVYREIINKIKAKCDIIIQVSTGGAVGMNPQERIAPVSLKPEMATLTTGTCNFGPDVFMNTLPDIEIFANEMKNHNVMPEIEVFDFGMINTAHNLMKKGLIPEKVNFDFVMGVPGALPGHSRYLPLLVSEIPPNCTWTVAGIGRFELPLAVMSIAMGGNVRVGFEDNIFYSKGVLAESNAQLVERIVRIAKENSREIANPDEARKIFGIKKNTADF
jgi:3-keto-5-aminohexanoate cleavage enzyme